MNWFKVKFRLGSWIASAWQSDTIFGHLCWGMRYIYGEEKLRDFLRLYDEGAPPLLVSNGFPGGFLPQPTTAPLVTEKKLPLITQREQFRQHKEAKGIKWLTEDEFNHALSGGLVIPSPKSKVKEGKRVTLKNQINRLTCTTDKEHPLYNFEEYYWPEITIYLKVTDDFTNVAKQLFQYIADIGYGKRKSIGYGQIESMTFEPFDGFKQPEKANGFVTLSNFVPSTEDPTEGSWKLIIKYGKMGEEWAAEDGAFKKPLLMLEAGSTFYDTTCRDCYGCLVKDLNPHYSRAVQYAFALPVPMALPPKTA